MALPQPVIELIEKLVTLSSQNKVKWSETGDESTFLAPVSKFTVIITKEDPNVVYPDYRLQIVDQSGKLIEDDFIRVSSDPNYELVANLFEGARRSARRGNEALSDMLSSLEQIR
jgi:hypothetical protein